MSIVSERSQMARSRLFEALRSPSGKLTFSPEIVIPEPSDPTAILLQSTGVTSMSEKVRVHAKANSAWISGSVNSLKTFCAEQEMARGNFPGPIPVIYCDDSIEDLASVAEAGAEGLLVGACGGEEVASLDDLASNSQWVDTCKAAWECGLQPIPEVTISDATSASWKEEEIEALASKISEVLGQDPVSILLTVNAVDDDDDDDEVAVSLPTEEVEKELATVSLPAVPKSLGKKIPFLGSVRAKAGGNRMGIETARFKEAGFTGALLRSDCIPGFRMNMDLDFVGAFWSACIGDLKSLKSKSFNFQSRNWMDKTESMEWSKYQKSILESGALGDPETSLGLNSEGGDYVGF